MKTHIALILLVILAVFTLVWDNIERAHAATYAAKTVVIKPFNGETNVTVVFRDAKTGNIFNATDGTSTAATAWADGLRRVASSRDELGSMGAAGRRHLDEHFRFDDFVASYEALYRTVGAG